MRKICVPLWRILPIVGCLAMALACDGDDGGSPTNPSGGGPGPSGATITIGANGTVSPASVSISVGQSVTFVNNDTQAHEMASDPHPSHTDCTAINAVGVLSPGQTRLTNALTTARSCGFHDHQRPSVDGLKGTIRVQ